MVNQITGDSPTKVGMDDLSPQTAGSELIRIKIYFHCFTYQYEIENSLIVRIDEVL